MGQGSGCPVVRVSVPTSCGSTSLFPPSAPPLVRTTGVADLSSSCVVGGIVRASGWLRQASAWWMMWMKCGGSFPDQLSLYLSWGYGVIPVLCTCCMPLPVMKGCICVVGRVWLVGRREDMSWGVTVTPSILIYVAGPGTWGLSW
jgi:hypothetical protein